MKMPVRIHMISLESLDVSLRYLSSLQPISHLHVASIELLPSLMAWLKIEQIFIERKLMSWWIGSSSHLVTFISLINELESPNVYNRIYIGWTRRVTKPKSKTYWVVSHKLNINTCTQITHYEYKFNTLCITNSFVIGTSSSFNPAWVFLDKKFWNLPKLLYYVYSLVKREWGRSSVPTSGNYTTTLCSKLSSPRLSLLILVTMSLLSHQQGLEITSIHLVDSTNSGNVSISSLFRAKATCTICQVVALLLKCAIDRETEGVKSSARIRGTMLERTSFYYNK